MISSMTGFGRGEARLGNVLVSVEVRSLNHRFLDIDVRFPRNLSACEMDIREMVGAQLSRGRVSITVWVRGDRTVGRLTVDKDLASSYVELLNGLRNDLGIGGDIELQHILNFPDILSSDDSGDVDEAVRGLVKKALEGALQDLKGLRQREGQEIEKDLKSRVNLVNGAVTRIEQHARQTSDVLFTRLSDKVKQLLDSDIADPGRLEMEVAILAEKADVTEECTRFKSHNTLFLELLSNGGSEGRKLNFLLQEMHREANTIGAKANDAQIAHWVVDIKEEVEKLREQIQNIE